MATHTVTLSYEQFRRLDSLVEGGSYSSQQEAVEQLLAQVLDAREASSYSENALAHLRRGMAQADRGEFITPEDLNTFFSDWRAGS